MTECRRKVEATTGEPTKETSTKKNGLKSDDCYVELNDFVLEGTAIAVETAVTPEVLYIFKRDFTCFFLQECKCKCAEGHKLYGEECASFLYYYDSKTCLINKQNRSQNLIFTNENVCFYPDSQIQKSSTLFQASINQEVTSSGHVQTKMRQDTNTVPMSVKSNLKKLMVTC